MKPAVPAAFPPARIAPGRTMTGPVPVAEPAVLSTARAPPSTRGAAGVSVGAREKQCAGARLDQLAVEPGVGNHAVEVADAHDEHAAGCRAVQVYRTIAVEAAVIVST